MDGKTLIVPVRGKVGDLASIYSFNETGTVIWQALESPRKVSELSLLVAERFAVLPAQAEHDVTSFVEEMNSVGLVDAVSQSGA